mmetsp:Transcript_4695/g.16525  ORF Transcript_4695/g.16525 Transcript_4695/m.16525 type:complete len:202 (-) Transcript_4695:50-655(-)
MHCAGRGRPAPSRRPAPPSLAGAAPGPAAPPGPRPPAPPTHCAPACALACPSAPLLPTRQQGRARHLQGSHGQRSRTRRGGGPFRRQSGLPSPPSSRPSPPAQALLRWRPFGSLVGWTQMTQQHAATFGSSSSCPSSPRGRWRRGQQGARWRRACGRLPCSLRGRTCQSPRLPQFRPGSRVQKQAVVLRRFLPQARPSSSS